MDYRHSWEEAANDLYIAERSIKRLTEELDAAKKDTFTLACRLYGEDEYSFGPETHEVMQRWRPIVQEALTTGTTKIRCYDEKERK